MSALLPLEILIADLKEIAHAPREDFLKISHHLEGLPRIMLSEAGGAAIVLAGAAKNVARQLPHASAENEQELRGIVLSLSAVLQNELNAADRERRPRRHWTED